MKWMEIRIIYEAPDPHTAMDLISDIFTDIGRPGVVQETPDDEPGTDWAGDAPPRSRERAVIGYLPENDQLSNAVSILSEKLTFLEKTCNIRSRVTRRRMDEEDWAESWKSHFHPFRIGERIVVKPSWHPYDPLPHDLILEIDPGMAFGTGTHATTAMCIRLLEKHLRNGDRFLDIGCGSGILMLAADKLGAADMTGVDTDPVAVSVATENMARNRIDREKFHIFSGDLTTGVTGRFDLVCANIRTRIICDLLGLIPPVLAPGGILICSGISTRGRDEILAQMRVHGFDIINELIETDWMALAVRVTSRIRETGNLPSSQPPKKTAT
jgi:ribosomal protein L11 methyltransferase